LIEILIFIVKLVIFSKRFITAFFVSIVFKPLYGLSRFIFNKIIVKGYCYYLAIIKKLGWSRLEGNFFSFLFSQKLVHVFVIGITIIIVFTNIVTKTRADVISERAHNTIIASLVKSEFGDIADEELIEEFFDEEANVSSQQSYMDSAVIKNQPQAVMMSPDEIVENENITSVIRGGSALVKTDIATTKKTKQLRTKIIYYTVESGDSISTIAAEFEITVNTILWENNLSSYSLIRPGDRLRILPTSGISHTVVRGDNLSKIAKKYNIEESKIIDANEIEDGAKLSVGEKLIIPGGRKSAYASYVSQPYTGISAIKDLVRPPGATPAASNKMNWPTNGHRITQYYSWRHHGVDIANKVGTPIYAADAGTIESVGWSTGYGNTIVINHGGGKKTRYGHLSKFYVKKGEKVGKGDTIGGMGSTGWSTGSHLHFEVIINGRKYNPLNYIR